MPSQKNIQKVQELSELLAKSKAVVLTDYSGLPVKKQSQLRQQVKNAGGQIMVVKNRLFKLALKEKTKIPKDIEESLQGPNAFLFAYEDEIAPIKALIEFSNQNDLPKTKIGIMFKPENRILTLEEIEYLASLPTRDQLLTQLISTINAPRYRLVNALSGNIRKLIYTLKEIKNNKQVN